MMKLVGLIPAAGQAKRLGNISSSKEVLEIEYQGKRQVLSKFLIDNYKEAGIENIHFIIRKGKWDIPEYYNNGADHGVNISYLFAQYSYGVPFTLYEATHFTENDYVALGFPDMHVTPTNIFHSLHQKIKETHSDLVLGIFPIETKSKWDMVQLNENGTITDIVIKPKTTDLKYGWSMAVWSPKFTKFLQKRVGELLANGEKERIQLEKDIKREIYPGDLFKEFILQGNKTDYVLFNEGKCIDLGTWEDFNNFNNGKEK